MEVDDIYQAIVNRGLYVFNTPEPITVLREQMRRHCVGLERTLVYEPFLFNVTDDGKYEVIMASTAQSKKQQTRRIQRALDKEEMIKLLTQAPQSPFKEIWRLMIFAAVLGYKENRKEPLTEVDTGRGIDDRIFANSPAWPGLMHLLALVATNNAEILSGAPNNEEKRITLFEEYANGGLSIIRERLESRSYSLDALCQFVASQVGNDANGGNTLSQISI